jgi:predicted TIM-barrel fold metal-dependent hydrolase
MTAAPTAYTLLPDPPAEDVAYGIVSVDDHVIEPPDAFAGRMPARFARLTPHVVEAPKFGGTLGAAHWKWDPDQSPIARGIVEPTAPRQAWRIGDDTYPLYSMDSCVGRPAEEWCMQPLRYDEMRPGTWQLPARLADMAQCGVVASVCFPALWAGFCGSTFWRAGDAELATALVRAWNDWHLEDWAAPSGGRIVPLQLPLLHDADDAAAEIHANAARGFRAVSFVENPVGLGLPSIHSGFWDPFLAACAETGTVVFLHGGSKGSVIDTSPDSPIEVTQSLFPVSGLVAAVDWLWSGIPVRFPDLAIALPEGGVGWLPLVVDWVDHNATTHNDWTHSWDGVDLRPSEVLLRNFWFCALDEPTAVHALAATVGLDHVVLEVDYPHADTSWPMCQQRVRAAVDGLGTARACAVTHANAARLLGVTLDASTPCRHRSHAGARGR